MSSGLRTTRARLFVGLALVAMLVWIFVPYYFLLVTSLVPQGTAVRGFEWPNFTTLDNYRQILVGANTLWPYLFNSIVVTLSVTLLALLIGVPAGYGLSRLRQFPAAKGLYLSFFVLRMLPPVAFVIPYFLLFSRLNLLDTRRGLVLALLPFSLSFTIWTIKAFFDGVPNDVEEAAQLDGANVLQTFTVIILPMVAQAVAATGLLTFLLAYVDYLFAVTLTRNTAVTYAVYLVTFANDYRVYVNAMMAATLLGTLPMIALYFYAQRFMRRMAIIDTV